MQETLDEAQSADLLLHSESKRTASTSMLFNQPTAESTLRKKRDFRFKTTSMSSQRGECTVVFERK